MITITSGRKTTVEQMLMSASRNKPKRRETVGMAIK